MRFGLESSRDFLFGNLSLIQDGGIPLEGSLIPTDAHPRQTLHIDKDVPSFS